MPRRALAALVLTGCNALFGLDDPATQPDASSDAAEGVDVDPARCFGSWSTICFTAPPVATASLPATLNTDPGSPACEPTDHPEYCVVGRAGDFTIGLLVKVQGTRPLVVVATGTLTIAAELDAASHRLDGSYGPGLDPITGLDPATCNTITLGNNHDGGAGGSMQGRGGAGGVGGGGTIQVSVPAASIAQPTTLFAGCRGARGNGENGALEDGGVRGAGGGAVWLIAGSRLEVTGTGVINASGAGGGGAQEDAGVQFGGGGGGSGGTIVLDAPTLSVSGSVFADGGGGGGGGGVGAGGDGGDPLGIGAGAIGGVAGCGQCSAGGAGSRATNLDGVTVSLPAVSEGGGGAGGGAGWILRPASATVSSSPPSVAF